MRLYNAESAEVPNGAAGLVLGNALHVRNGHAEPAGTDADISALMSAMRTNPLPVSGLQAVMPRFFITRDFATAIGVACRARSFQNALDTNLSICDLYVQVATITDHKNFGNRRV